MDLYHNVFPCCGKTFQYCAGLATVCNCWRDQTSSTVSRNAMQIFSRTYKIFQSFYTTKLIYSLKYILLKFRYIWIYFISFFIFRTVCLVSYLDMNNCIRQEQKVTILCMHIFQLIFFAFKLHFMCNYRIKVIYLCRSVSILLIYTSLSYNEWNSSV